MHINKTSSMSNRVSSGSFPTFIAYIPEFCLLSCMQDNQFAYECRFLRRDVQSRQKFEAAEPLLPRIFWRNFQQSMSKCWRQQYSSSSLFNSADVSLSLKKANNFESCLIVSVVWKICHSGLFRENPWQLLLPDPLEWLQKRETQSESFIRMEAASNEAPIWRYCKPTRGYMALSFLRLTILSP